MASITLAVDNELKLGLECFSWVNWSEVVREELIKEEKKRELLERLNSKEEQELIKWSVELGRKAKEGRFKQLLKEVAPETRKKLLSSMSSENRAKYE